MLDFKDKIIPLPSGPPCRKCGHPPCPFCETWCDDLDCTCEDNCTYNEDDHAAWLDIIEPFLKPGRMFGQRRYVFTDPTASTAPVVCNIPLFCVYCGAGFNDDPDRHVCAIT